MTVKLVSLTQSLITEQNLSPEELLVYIARVSNPSNQLNTETADKLIRYMIKHKHWSPFDMVNLTVEVKTSRAIAHQILRHWSIKPQEFSQRYAEATEYEPIELRLKAQTNRQSSTGVVGGVVFQRTENELRPIVSAKDNYFPLMKKFADLVASADALYKEALAAGVAAECARFILPLCTQTTMYLNGSVRSWIHYLEQRTDPHAQAEHQLVANAVKELFTAHFPNIIKALDNE